MRCHRGRPGGLLAVVLATSALALATWPLIVWQSSQGHPSPLGEALEVLWVPVLGVAVAAVAVGAAVASARRRTRR